MERRLGRGLGSLLGQADQQVPEEAKTPSETPRELPVAQIRPNPHQPRKTFDPEGLEELRESIRRHGFLQPIVVRRQGDAYELIAGERRWRAAAAEGLATIPAHIRADVGDGEMLELALVENVQRRDLDALEKARGYARLIQDLGLTQEQVAEKVGLKRATVTNHLRLLELPANAQDALSKGLISMGHARALLPLGDPERVRRLLERIPREGLSVRQVEEAVRPPVGSGSTGSANSQVTPQAPWVGEVQRRLRDSLSAKVTVLNRPGFSGQIVIEYHDQAELNRLLEQLAPAPRL